MSKYNPLGRLHRDPDAIDYKSPGWMESGMEKKRRVQLSILQHVVVEVASRSHRTGVG